MIHHPAEEDAHVLHHERPPVWGAEAPHAKHHEPKDEAPEYEQEISDASADVFEGDPADYDEHPNVILATDADLKNFGKGEAVLGREAGEVVAKRAREQGDYSAATIEKVIKALRLQRHEKAIRSTWRYRRREGGTWILRIWMFPWSVQKDDRTPGTHQVPQRGSTSRTSRRRRPGNTKDVVFCWDPHQQPRWHPQ